MSELAHPESIEERENMSPDNVETGSLDAPMDLLVQFSGLSNSDCLAGDNQRSPGAGDSPITMSSLLVKQLNAVSAVSGLGSANSNNSLDHLSCLGSSPTGLINEDDKKRKFVCRFCQKGFSLMNVLKVHERIHTGEKPYTCEICNKAFNQSGSLNRHRNTHKKRYHDNRCYSCRFCPSQFLYASHLQDHETSAHGSELSALDKTSAGGGVAGNVASSVNIVPPTSGLNGLSNVLSSVTSTPVSTDPLIDRHVVTNGLANTQVTPITVSAPVLNKKTPIRCGLEGDTLVCELCDASFTSKAELQVHHNQHYVQQLAMMVMTQDPAAASILFPSPANTVQPFNILSRIQTQNNAVAVLAALQQQQQQQTQQQQQQLQHQTQNATTVLEQLVAFKKEPAVTSPVKRAQNGERGHLCKYCGKNFAQNGTLRRHYQTCKHGPHRNALSSATATVIAPKVAAPLAMATASPCGSSGVEGGSKSGRGMAGTDASSEVGSVSPGMDTESHLGHDKVDGPEDLSIYAGLSIHTPNGRSKDHSVCSPARSISPATSTSGRGTPKQPNSRRLEDICAALLEKSAKTTSRTTTTKPPTPSVPFQHHHHHSPTQTFLSTIGATKVDDCELKDLMRYLTLSGKLYRCEHCQIFFLDSAMFHLHRGMHDTCVPYRCAICAYRADDKYRFQLHFMEHKVSGGAEMDTADSPQPSPSRNSPSPPTTICQDADDVAMVTSDAQLKAAESLSA